MAIIELKRKKRETNKNLRKNGKGKQKERKLVWRHSRQLLCGSYISIATYNTETRHTEV